MSDVERVTAFLVAALVIIVIPGPSVLFVVGRALAHGRSVAVASVLGNAVGSALVLVLVALGLGTLVQSSAIAFTTLKLLGAAYLVYLGVQAIRHRGALTPTDAATPIPPLDTRRAVRQGVVVGVSNPKVFVMFAALLPQFVDPEAGSVPGQMLALGAIVLVIGLLSDGVWALGASRLRTVLVRTPRRTAAVVATGGVSMIGLGAWMAVGARP